MRIEPRTALALRTLSLAYFVQATGALSVVGALEPISRTWHLHDSQSAYLISVFGITFAIAAPLLQVLLGHLRRRSQVLLGVSVFSASALLFAVAPNYALLLAARLIMGLGAALIAPVLGALASSLVERRHQGSAIAMVVLGLSVASMVGIPVSSWIAQTWGPRALYVIVAVAGVATAALIARFVPNTSLGERVPLTSIRSLLVRRDTISAFLVVFFIGAGVYATYAFIAPIIRDVFHAGPHLISVSLVVLGVAGVTGNLFVTRAARRYSAEGMLAIAMCLLALDLLLLWVVPARMGWLFVVLTLWAFATDIVWPSQQRRIVELTPDVRGIALALTASFVYSGMGFGSAVAGWVYPVHGFVGLLISSLVLLGISAVTLWISSGGRIRFRVDHA
ncbi:MFS transporter [Pararobbsia silviterrae]|uniref:MFS transporter n=2 Tax=Pararobbsia silviterrae TaxID=1792498 RepID=A0A494XD91_9BURK|nr:MFS transporter [Pararobbsia silviterrae]